MKAATDIDEATGGRIVISIHAAREGGDTVEKLHVYSVGISIHAAREGGDGQRAQR